MSKRMLNQPKPPGGKSVPFSIRATIGGPPAWAVAAMLVVSIGAVYGPALSPPPRRP